MSYHSLVVNVRVVTACLYYFYLPGRRSSLSLLSSPVKSQNRCFYIRSAICALFHNPLASGTLSSGTREKSITAASPCQLPVSPFSANILALLELA